MPKVDFNISQRINEIDAPGYKLAELGEKYPNIVVVNADLGITNRSKAFYLKFPERSFDVGIAEQNMVSFASGLAHEGFMPVSYTHLDAHNLDFHDVPLRRLLQPTNAPL